MELQDLPEIDAGPIGNYYGDTCQPTDATRPCMDAAIQILTVERARKQAELDALTVSAKALRAAIVDIDNAVAALGGVVPRGAISLKHVIAQILQEEPALSPAQIGKALEKIGRTTGVNTVLGTLSRARSEGIVRKVGRVWYASDAPSNPTA